MAFLDGFTRRRVHLRDRPKLRPLGLYLGQGNLALEIVSLSGTAEPSPPGLKDSLEGTLAGRGVPLLLIAIHSNSATLCGPAGEDHHPPRPRSRPGGPNVSRGACGVGPQCGAVLGIKGQDLLHALGFASRRHDALTSILQTRNRDRALAILLDQTGTPPEAPPPSARASRRCPMHLRSPTSGACPGCGRPGEPHPPLSHGRRPRRRATRPHRGLGGVADRPDARRLRGSALAAAVGRCEHGTLDALLDSSNDFPTDLATRLGARLY